MFVIRCYFEFTARRSRSTTTRVSMCATARPARSAPCAARRTCSTTTRSSGRRSCLQPSKSCSAYVFQRVLGRNHCSRNRSCCPSHLPFLSFYLNSQAFARPDFFASPPLASPQTDVALIRVQRIRLRTGLSAVQASPPVRLATRPVSSPSVSHTTLPSRYFHPSQVMGILPNEFAIVIRLNDLFHRARP